MTTRLIRVDSDLYDILKANSKTNKKTITFESKQLAIIYTKSKEIEGLLGIDLLSGKQKRPIVVFK